MSALENTERETLQIVLEEISNEQARNTKAVNDLVTAVNSLSGRFKELDDKLDKPKQISVSSDTLPIQEIMKKGVADMKIIVSTKPQPVVKKFQILLFPERDAKLFYKIVFGRWMLYLVLIFLINFCYDFAVHYNDSQINTEKEQLENDRIRKAWQHLYENEGKAGKRLMDTTLNQITNQG
jgi:hypothetical protein